MARTSKPSSVRKGKDLNKQELERLNDIEERLKGGTDQLDNIPKHLTEEEKIYYKWIIKELRTTEILSNIDIPLIEQTAHCIYVLRKCSDEIKKNGILVNGADKYGNPIPKENPALKIDINYMTKYGQLCNQLGLSPSARANLAQKKVDEKDRAEDPILKALQELNG